MDKMYILSTIQKIEEEKSKHDEKFKGRPEHKDCLPRFDQAIAKLQAELQKLEEQKDVS